MANQLILLTVLVVLFCTFSDGRNTYYGAGGISGSGDTGGILGSGGAGGIFGSGGDGSSIGTGGVYGSVSVRFPRSRWWCTCRPHCLRGELKVQKTCFIPNNPVINGPHFPHHWDSCCKVLPFWVRYLRGHDNFYDYDGQDGFGYQEGFDGQDGFGSGIGPNIGPIRSGGGGGSGSAGGGFVTAGGPYVPGKSY